MPNTSAFPTLALSAQWKARSQRFTWIKVPMYERESDRHYPPGYARAGTDCRPAAGYAVQMVDARAGRHYRSSGDQIVVIGLLEQK